MELTPEFKAFMLKELGKKPWEADIVVNAAGEAEMVPLTTQDRGAGEVFARNLGEEVPAGAAMATGTTAGSVLAAPTAMKVAKMIPGWPGKAAGAGIGLLSAIAGGIGGRKVYDAAGAPTPVRALMSQTTAQDMRDTEAHPIAQGVGRFFGDMTSFRSSVPGLIKVGRAAFARKALDEAGKQTLKNVGVNSAVGAGLEGVNEKLAGEDLSLTKMGKAAGANALLGAVRGTGAGAKNTKYEGKDIGLAGLGRALGELPGRFLGGHGQSVAPSIETTAEPAPAENFNTPSHVNDIGGLPEPSIAEQMGEAVPKLNAQIPAEPRLTGRAMGMQIDPNEVARATTQHWPIQLEGADRGRMYPMPFVEGQTIPQIPFVVGSGVQRQPPSTEIPFIGGGPEDPAMLQQIVMQRKAAETQAAVAAAMAQPSTAAAEMPVQSALPRGLEELAQRLMGNQIFNPNKYAQRPAPEPLGAGRELPQAAEKFPLQQQKQQQAQVGPRELSADELQFEKRLRTQALNALAASRSLPDALAVAKRSNASAEELAYLSALHQSMSSMDRYITPARRKLALRAAQQAGSIQQQEQQQAQTLQDYLQGIRTRMPRPKAEAAEELPLQRQQEQQQQTGEEQPAWHEQQMQEQNQVKDAPTPEAPAVLAEAFKAAADPRSTKKAVFVPNGSPPVKPSFHFTPFPHKSGTLWVNTAKMTPNEALAAVSGDQIDGTVLGLSQTVKPPAGDTAVVTDRPGAPAVLTEVVAGPAAVPDAVAAQALAVPGGTQRVTTPAEVVNTRAAMFTPIPQVSPLGRRAAGPSAGQAGATQAPQARPAAPQVPPGNPPPASALGQGPRGGSSLPPAPSPLQNSDRLTPGQEFTPMSVVANAAKVDPQVGTAGADYFARLAQLVGQHFTTPIHELNTKFHRDVIDSAIWKRSRAFQDRTQPQFTPDEAQVNAVYDKAMKDTAAASTAAGLPVKPLDLYVAEMFDPIQAREVGKGVNEYIAARGKEFMDLNQRIHGNQFDPVEAATYMRAYLTGVSTAPNSLGSDFGALTKSARQYHLPDSWREQDQLRNLERFGDRWGRQMARHIEIDSKPDVAAKLGYRVDPSILLPPDSTAANPHIKNLKAAMDDVLFNEGRNANGISPAMGDLFTATQQFANSSAMQTATALGNSISKWGQHMSNVHNAADAQALAEGALAPFKEWATQRDKAIAMNFVRPGRDPNAIDSSNIGTAIAQNIQRAGLVMRKYTGGDLSETFNRVQDYSIGEKLAELNIPLFAKGDPAAIAFVERFGAGVKKGMTPAEQIALMARNYGISVQSSYSAEGLPATMLKSGIIGSLARIQRFGFENMNRVRKTVLEPAANGDWGPLLGYAVGTALSYPVLKKMRELFSGRPSGLPTSEEIAAGKKPAVWEHVFNIMSMAQITGAMGFAGSVAGGVAQNIRGNAQSLVGDPVIGFSTGLANNMVAASEAIRQGEPVLPSIMEALKRSLIDNMQLARGVNARIRGDAEDVRTKRLFEYLTEQRHVSLNQMAAGATGLGQTYTPEISPTKAAAREGDRDARLKVDKDERAALDNYRGGFEDRKKEAAYRKFIRDTQGEEKLSGYLARRRKYKLKVHGQP